MAAVPKVVVAPLALLGPLLHALVRGMSKFLTTFYPLILGNSVEDGDSIVDEQAKEVEEGEDPGPGEEEEAELATAVDLMCVFAIICICY